MLITTTAINGTIEIGDRITMPVRLTRWQRFLIWIASPFRWPPKWYDKQFIITTVSGGISFEVED